LLFNTFTRTLIFDRSNYKFGFGVLLGLSFSIAVILSTIGLMDGFTIAMRGGLQSSSGDLYFYSRSGFFELSTEEEQEILNLGLTDLTGYIETQAFLVFGESSKGISVKGINGEEFRKLSGLEINPDKQSIVIGSVLAEQLKVKNDDEVVVVLAKGNKGMDGLPSLKRFRVSGIVKHGIYEKDLRFVYMNRDELAHILGVESRVNIYAVNVKNRNQKEMGKVIDNYRFEIEDKLGIDFRVKPYWYDYGSLLEAVEIQKLTIGLVLQIIVVVSIFNVLSFITFLDDRRAQQIFLFQALGMGPKDIRKTWYGIITILWLLSCAFSQVFVFIFEWGLENLSFLKLPGSVYNLERIPLSIDLSDYLLVFLSTLFWMFIILSFALYRMSRKSILSGLREEFA
jgi:ABC-type lipoprotein release transport system permease subunit